MINVLFCGNEKIFDGLLSSTLSILMRKESDEPICFYVFTMDLSEINQNFKPISEKQIEFLSNLIKSYNNQNCIKKIDVTDIYKSELLGGVNESTKYSPYSMIRLLADKVDEIPDKILYLDVDILFQKDISLVWNVDIEEYEYAGAKDHYGRFFINPKYINSGVLLLNMKKIRETKLFEKARHLVKTKKMMFPDQSALHKCATKKLILPHYFNDQKHLSDKTIIKHFSMQIVWLPWFHTRNIKQWDIYNVHKVFKYNQFDDILNEYIYQKKLFKKEKI